MRQDWHDGTDRRSRVQQISGRWRTPFALVFDGIPHLDGSVRVGVSLADIPLPSGWFERTHGHPILQCLGRSWSDQHSPSFDPGQLPFKQLSRHSHLGQLKGDVVGVADGHEAAALNPRKVSISSGTGETPASLQ